MRKISYVLYTLPVSIGIVYIFLIILAWNEKASSGTHLAARLSIAVPEIVIWCIATIGAVRMKNYAHSIRRSADGMSLNMLANALLLMVAYIILLAMRNTIAHPFAHTAYLSFVIGLRNYIPIAVLLTATLLLYGGSRRLVRMVHGTVWNQARLAAFNLICTICFTSYVAIFYLVEPHASSISGVPRFAFPVHILIITYVLPYLCIWAIGLVSCVQLAYYAANVPGKIYRILFRDLYIGLLIVFAGIFIAQLGVVSRFAGMQQFSTGMLLIYGLQAILATGFLYLWKGAKALNKIEEL